MLWVKNIKTISVALIIFTCIVFQLFNSVTGISLVGYGIYPRSHDYLSGILFSPFIHVSWVHLINNLIPFSIFSWLICQSSLTRYWTVFIGTTLAGGLLVWLFGRSVLHVGLSGVIYGLWGYLIAYGLVLRSIKSLLISLFVLGLYSYLIWGIFPTDVSVSFEGHLFGAVSGLVLGYLLARLDKSQKSIQ